MLDYHSTLTLLLLLVILFLGIGIKYLYRSRWSALQPIRVAILIISTTQPNNKRYAIEKEYWKKYMHSNKHIDCFFIECGQIEHFNTLTLQCKESYTPGIFQKTIQALDKVGGKYDYYIRTNLNSFFIFENLIQRLKTIPRDIPIYTGGWCAPGNWVSGTSIILNKKSRDILVEKGIQDKYYNNSKPDDVVIGLVMYENKIMCDDKKCKNILYVWNFDISYESNIKEVESKKIPILRIHNKEDIQPYQNIAQRIKQK